MEYNAAFQKNELDLYRYKNIYDLSFHKKEANYTIICIILFHLH